MTFRAGLELYIVKEGNTRCGIACPAWIQSQVLRDERVTRPAREQQAAARHSRDTDAASRALAQHFPAMPAADAARLLRTAWKVGSGRVGRRGALNMAEKVRLAAQAYARHQCTDYDARLARGERRDAARDATKAAVQAQMRQWMQASETAAAPREGKENKVGRERKQARRAGKMKRPRASKTATNSVSARFGKVESLEQTANIIHLLK
jgi:hypothetical protein